MQFINKAICVILFIFFLYAFAASAAVLKTDPAHLNLRRAGSVSIPFIENRGQVETKDVKYYADTFGGRVCVTTDGRLIYGCTTLKRGENGKPLIQEKPVDASVKKVKAKDKAPTKVNFYPGPDRRKWLKDLPTYQRIDMGEIYPGVRMALAAHGNTVEKLFYVQPKADARRIRLQVDGGGKPAVNDAGELKITSPNGTLSFSKPVAYQTINGRKTPVEVAYCVKDNHYGFKLGKYDPARELVIDPLINSIFIESSSEGRSMAVDGQDNLYVAGHFGDGFGVWKFDSRIETLLESSYFGLRYHNNNLWQIAIDSQGNVFVAGNTDIFTPDEFPTTEGAFDTISQRLEGFIVKFDADLNLTAATFIGGQMDDDVKAIAIDQNDTIYLAATVGQNGPTEPELDLLPTGYDTTPGPRNTDKVAILQLDNGLETLLASTLLGGNSDDDRAAGIAIDPQGNIVVSGDTDSSDFPLTQGVADAAFEGPSEGFISKLDPTLTHLLASTYMGGNDSEWVTAMAIDPDNNIFVSGRTESLDFPVTQNGYDTTHDTYADGFLAKLSSDLSTLLGATYIGGSGYDTIRDVCLQSDGSIAVAGFTESSDFPTTPACHDPTYDVEDGFVAIMDGSLTDLMESTYLGGTFDDSANAILENNENLYISGRTNSDDFPYITEEYYIGTSLFVSRFNPNEEPQAPADSVAPSSALAGHWQSADRLSTLSAIGYLEIDICDNGDFSGLGGIYTCTGGTGAIMYCNWESDDFGEQVSGQIDFTTNEGLIDFETSPDVTFTITFKSVDKLVFKLNTSDAWDLNMDIYSELYYEGEPGEYCGATGEGGSDAADGKSGGGGGGGCFMTALTIFK